MNEKRETQRKETEKVMGHAHSSGFSASRGRPACGMRRVCVCWLWFAHRTTAAAVVNSTHAQTQ